MADDFRSDWTGKDCELSVDGMMSLLQKAEQRLTGSTSPRLHVILAEQSPDQGLQSS